LGEIPQNAYRNKKGVVYKIIFAPISDIHHHHILFFLKRKKGRDGNPFTKNTNQIKA
jgi:hypothetical protein